MSLHNIFLQRMTLENQDVLTGPDFDKTFNAMYEMATKNIEKQRQAKIEQEEIARNNDQIMASFNGGPNTNSEKFIKKTSFSSDAKGRLIPKVTIEEKPTDVGVQPGFRVKSYNTKGDITYERDPIGAEGLSYEQQLRAAEIAKRFGVRNFKETYGLVTTAMSEGKTVDEIEDMLRYGKQSAEFSGDIRNAVQSMTFNLSDQKTQQIMDFIDDNVQTGNMVAVKENLKKVARDTAGTDMSKNILGKERTVEFLSEIQSDLDTLERMGINTNIFTGTVEAVANKVGTVKNPEARKLATKILAAYQNYRRSMTGVAFSVPETAEYKQMFPSIGRTANFNKANIDGLKEVLSGDLNNFYSLSMGPENFKKLFPESVVHQFNTPEEALAAGLPSGTIVIVGGRKAVLE